MIPRWRVFRLVVGGVGFWIAQQGKTLLTEAFATHQEAVEFAQAAARESWGYRA